MPLTRCTRLYTQSEAYPDFVETVLPCDPIHSPSGLMSEPDIDDCAWDDDDDDARTENEDVDVGGGAVSSTSGLMTIVLERVPCRERCANRQIIK